MQVGEPVDYETLGSVLRVLASMGRLELVSLLRRPHAIQDIYLAPTQVRPGENPDRASSRQAVQAHLDKLVEVGLVVAGPSSDPSRRGKEYAVNPQRFYQVLEEFRKVGTLTRGAPVARDETINVDASVPPELPRGPKLLLVRGLVEGEVFPLRRADLADGRGWIVGRKPDIHVSLAYDPFVSLENAEIIQDDAHAFSLLDLRSSKNGTWLNWRRLEKGARVELTPGDVIGVGRSALVFREA